MSRRFLFLFLAAVPLPAAQSQSPPSTNRVHTVLDLEWERFLRAQQVLGRVPMTPWSIRGFGPDDVAILTSTATLYPWTSAPAVWRGARDRAWTAVIPASVNVVINSSFPFGYNDGPVWAGKGVTGSAQFGIAAGVGPLTAVLAPIAFTSQNGSFSLAPNGMNGDFMFGDPFSPTTIDRPQRFGSGAYARLDPGESTIRLDQWGAALGISTANEFWGPARDHPLLLGNNAAGFPHIFTGTSTPVDIWIARLHARIIWGQLAQSRFTEMQNVERRRFASGLVALIVPRGVPGLEIGGARFFHQLWPDSGPTREDFLRPLTGLLKISRIAQSGNPLGDEPDNQLASAFFRWAFPSAGFEVYGEIGREDHNVTLRDLAKQPDHIAGYMLGIQRVWDSRSAPPGTRSYALRAEVLNTRISANQLVRLQTPFYVHDPVRQGHTHLGQVLGSEGGFGGGAAVLALDRYDASGRMSIGWTRLMRAERPEANGVPDPMLADVFHTLGLDGMWFRSSRTAVTYELTAVYETNRDFRRDAFNLRAATGARLYW